VSERVNHRVRRLAGAALLVALAAAALPARADDALPFPLQAALLRKIATYDAALARAPVRVLVVGGRLSAPAAQALAQAFRDAGLAADVADAERLRAPEAPALVYAFPDVPGAELREACRTGAALCVSGEAALAERGLVPVAVRARAADGRPEIVVNLEVLRADGRALDSGLLRLATRVGARNEGGGR
jgi:hypothetical protein